MCRYVETQKDDRVRQANGCMNMEIVRMIHCSPEIDNFLMPKFTFLENRRVDQQNTHKRPEQTQVYEMTGSLTSQSGTPCAKETFVHRPPIFNLDITSVEE